MPESHDRLDSHQLAPLKGGTPHDLHIIKKAVQETTTNPDQPVPLQFKTIHQSMCNPRTGRPENIEQGLLPESHDSPDSHRLAPLKGGTPHDLHKESRTDNQSQPTSPIAIHNPATIPVQSVYETAGEYRTRTEVHQTAPIKGGTPHYHRITP